MLRPGQPVEPVQKRRARGPAPCELLTRPGLKSVVDGGGRARGVDRLLLAVAVAGKFRVRGAVHEPYGDESDALKAQGGRRDGARGVCVCEGAVGGEEREREQG